jgi:RNA polymerase sigma-70 factor (ECF subfamily)
MSAKKSKNHHVAHQEFSDDWDEVLLGNREIFKEMTEPFIPALLDAARHDIKRETMDGNLHPDILRPEELVGETLIQAWIRRYSRLHRESLKEWLLATQRWALRLVVLEEKDWAKGKAISLEEPAKPRLADYDNDEWDLITPQSMVRECWRDIIADESSISHAV